MVHTRMGSSFKNGLPKNRANVDQLRMGPNGAYKNQEGQKDKT